MNVCRRNFRKLIKHQLEKCDDRVLFSLSENKRWTPSIALARQDPISRTRCGYYRGAPIWPLCSVIPKGCPRGAHVHVLRRVLTAELCSYLLWLLDEEVVLLGTVRPSNMSKCVYRSGPRHAPYQSPASITHHGLLDNELVLDSP